MPSASLTSSTQTSSVCAQRVTTAWDGTRYNGARIECNARSAHAVKSHWGSPRLFTAFAGLHYAFAVGAVKVEHAALNHPPRRGLECGQEVALLVHDSFLAAELPRRRHGVLDGQATPVLRVSRPEAVASGVA